MLDSIERHNREGNSSNGGFQKEMESSLAGMCESLGSIKGAGFVIDVLKEVHRRSSRHGLTLARVWDISADYLV